MMLFKEWLKNDIEDSRKINYEVYRAGKVEHFTSDDEVSMEIMDFLSTQAVLMQYWLFNNEWYVVVKHKDEIHIPDDVLKIEDLLQYVINNKLEDLYNKVGNRLYKDFGLQSAEVNLMVAYMINEMGGNSFE